MATKPTPPDAAAGADEAAPAATPRSSAQQIWEAGLGAFAKAQEEGTRALSRLIQEGNELQQRSKKAAGAKVAGVSDTVGDLAEGVSRQVSGSWDKLEQVFEERVARALGKMGVPAQAEIAALQARVAQLEHAVALLTAQSHAVAAPVPAPAARKVAAAAKPVARAVSKTPAKTLPKTAAKSVAKAAPKAAAKATLKAPPKAAPKVAAKAAPKAAAKVPLKAAAKVPLKAAAIATAVKRPRAAASKTPG